MKKSIIVILVVILLVFAAGCTQLTETEQDKAEMVHEATDDMSKEMAEDKESEDMTEDKDAQEMEQPKESAEEAMVGKVTEAGYIDVTPEEAKMLIDTTPDLVIVDVSPKYAQGHLPGAINYYVGDGSLDAAIAGLDKSKPYLVYCHVDSASIMGAKKLVEAGFNPVYRLEGNYSAWVDAGYPIEE